MNLSQAELRAAAERLAIGWRSYKDDQHCGIADSENVAEAYLAEHPADDDEPITEEMLRPHLVKALHFAFHPESRDWHVSWHGWPLAPIKTRRDLRLLLEALGV